MRITAVEKNVRDDLCWPTMDMASGTWRCRCFCGVRLELQTAARALPELTLHGCNMGQAGGRIFTCGNGNENHEIWTGFSVHKRNMSAAVTDRTACIILRGRWCEVVLNAHAERRIKPKSKNSSAVEIYCHVINVTLDGVCIGNRIYWTFKHLVIHFTDH
jgi:hypothetical protein